MTTKHLSMLLHSLFSIFSCYSCNRKNSIFFSPQFLIRFLCFILFNPKSNKLRYLSMPIDWFVFRILANRFFSFSQIQSCVSFHICKWENFNMLPIFIVKCHKQVFSTSSEIQRSNWRWMKPWIHHYTPQTNEELKVWILKESSEPHEPFHELVSILYQFSEVLYS